ncbi:hypothetical protein FSP39_014219 [Pinctada imbricata]|uniref:Uncharacterized protein n=1 Tax=Pinctada imbricata TaxID=66713 RepID=A0AA89C975_PINIB|nr:hypothetical protein FSP39_014219 [Pinctada imbricata]
MKHLPFTICFLQLVSYSACQEIYASNCNHVDERQLLAEITGLRQLVIQESLCRQELERQIREFRQLLLHDESQSITGTDRGWNMSLSSDTGVVTEKLDRITRLIESKITRIEGNISQVFSAVKKQEIQMESIKETYLNLSLNIQELNMFLKGNGWSSSENVNHTNDDKVRETQTTNPGATIDITPMTESDSNNVFTTRDDSAVRQDSREKMSYLPLWISISMMLGCCLCNNDVIYKLSQSWCHEIYSIPSRDCRWVAGLYRYVDVAILNGQIIAYQIRWKTGKWSNWYVPGVNDIDDKINTMRRTCGLPYKANSMRRMWSYFYYHDHKYIICNNQ